MIKYPSLRDRRTERNERKRQKNDQRDSRRTRRVESGMEECSGGAEGVGGGGRMRPQWCPKNKEIQDPERVIILNTQEVRKPKERRLQQQAHGVWARRAIEKIEAEAFPIIQLESTEVKRRKKQVAKKRTIRFRGGV